MKKKNISSILPYLAAILFYVAAIIGFTGGSQNTVSTVWLCLGSLFLCIGVSRSKRNRQDKNKTDNK